MANKTNQQKLKNAIASSQNYILSKQYPEGYWWGELESNVTITSEVVLLHKIWGSDRTIPLKKAEYYLRNQQTDRGSWELYYGDGGDLSTSVEAYMALRILGVAPEDEALVRAKKFILENGGISKTRIFTKLHLALIGCYDWRGIPSIPPWVMLLPEQSPFNIYDMASWARGSTVPLIIVFNQKPVFVTQPVINLDDLFTEGIDNVSYDLPHSNDWTDIFLYLDEAFKLAEKLDLVPLKEEGLKAAERWILERQEPTGDWGGIIPAMVNSLFALRCLDYEKSDPIVQKGLKAIDNFSISDEKGYRVQPCVSPVWDTAWCIRALLKSGCSPQNLNLIKAGEWLLEKQILDYGDWAVKNKEGQPGAWAFEFDNRYYPDIDDSAVVIMALKDLKIPNTLCRNKAISRGVDWISSMQCQDGGWAAFDRDNNLELLNLLPYSDLKATIDPNTVDVTARVLEMVGSSRIPMNHKQIQKAVIYLLKEQESDGSWFGRWGVNYIYGTSSALSALSVIAPKYCRPNINMGANWLVDSQNPDGGWGETCESYRDSSLKGKGVSTASQTSWALIGLVAASDSINFTATESIDRGVNFLLETQKEDGTWEEDYFTGTGFPNHFYLKYHLYQQYFPLLALGIINNSQKFSYC